MQAIITKLLNKAIIQKPEMISYYEKIPLSQVHIDTMFFELTKKKQLIPIFIIVDVATRYTQAYIQSKKNENILDHINDFVSQVRKRWKSSAKDDKDILIMSDGAKEFNVIKKSDYRHKVSVSINKAAIAEAAIKRIRSKFRHMETDNFLDAIMNRNNEKVIDLEFLKTELPKIITILNKTAKIRPPPKIEEIIPPKFELGTLVFAKSKEKYDADKLGLKLTKMSYKLNYDPEPLIINRVITFNNKHKYEVMSLNNHESLKYYYYEEELQEIPDKVALDYIENYNSYWNKRENIKFEKKTVNWDFLKK